MSTNSTVYDVQIRYALDDKASSALAHLGGAAEKAERSLGGLKETLGAVGLFFGARELFGLGKELFVGFNSEMEQLRQQMAGIITMNFDMPFEKSAAMTEYMVSGWQKFSQTTVLTTKQITEFGKNLSASITAAGGSVQDIYDMTKKGSVIASALVGTGEGDMQYAGMEIAEALMSGVRKTQRFNMQFLTPELKKQGKTIEDWNQASLGSRLEMMKKAMADPAWNQVIKAQATSFLGVTSTLKDLVQILGGKAGSAFFGELKKELSTINDWLRANETLVEGYAHKFGDSLIKGFHALRDAVKFLVDNRETLAIVGAWMVGGSVLGKFGVGAAVGGTALGKGGAVAADLAGRAVSGATIGYLLQQMHNTEAEFVKMQTGIAGVTGAMSTMPGLLGQVGTGLFALHQALQFFADWWDSNQTKHQASNSDIATVYDAVKKGQLSDALAVSLKDSGAYDENGGLDVKKYRMYLSNKGMTYTSNANFQAGEMMQQLVATMDPQKLRRMLGLKNESLPDDQAVKTDPLATGKGGGKPTKVDVTIHKIEVASQDPDRFAFGFTKAIGRIVRNPTQARDAFREG